MIELVGAGGYADRPIGECSGGEQQRLLIAQALVRRPRLLLLDEPLDSLDLPNQAAVAALISRICAAEGVTVVIVAHDVNPILAYLDRVVYIAAGGAASGTAGRGDHRARRSPGCTGTPVEVLRTSAGPARRRRPAGGTRRARRPPRRGRRAVSTGFSWNLLADFRQMWAFPFMVNAFRAGTIVAVVAGLIGWFMVLRRQTFAGHTLCGGGVPRRGGRHPASGSAPPYGYFAFCVAAAVLIAAATRGARSAGGQAAESALTGTVQAFALACGLLFVALYKGFLNGTTALLFGSFLGITDQPGRRASPRWPSPPSPCWP